jgi:VanZ family protein
MTRFVQRLRQCSRFEYNTARLRAAKIIAPGQNWDDGVDRRPFRIDPQTRRARSNRFAKAAMEGAHAQPRTSASLEPDRVPPRWSSGDRPDNGAQIAAIHEEANYTGRILSRIESVYITTAILLSIAFLYASTVPWVFAVPDVESRMSGVMESLRLHPVQPLDLFANILVFIPMGFVWSAAWSTPLSEGRRRRVETTKAAIGCVALAVFAEVLQFWIPLRDPSIRDVLALGCGALLGCCLWLAAGAQCTGMLCGLIGRPRLFQFLRPLSFAVAYVSCLIVIRYASPIRLFLAYRNWSISLQHIAVSPPNLGAPQSYGLWALLLRSGVAALLLVGACEIGRVVVRSLKSPRLG